MKYFLPIVALLTAFAELQGTDEFIAANTGNVTTENPLIQEVPLRTGDTFETTIRLVSPSTLFPNARLRVSFALVAADDEAQTPVLAGAPQEEGALLADGGAVS